MATPDSVADILNKAADLIEPEGAWIQGELVNGCAFCALGAIEAAEDLASQNWDNISGADYFLRDVIGELSIAEWNDDPKRTQAEVVSALRAAAVKARAA